MTRLRAHLYRHEVAIPVPVPALFFDAGRWQINVDPSFWRWGRFNFPPRWQELPPVDGEVAPIVRTWAFGCVHVKRFRWRDGS